MIKSIEIGGFVLEQYPDFEDAFIEYAEDEEGNPLTLIELDELTSNGWLNEYLLTEYLPGYGE